MPLAQFHAVAELIGSSDPARAAARIVSKGSSRLLEEAGTLRPGPTQASLLILSEKVARAAAEFAEAGAHGGHTL